MKQRLEFGMGVCQSLEHRPGEDGHNLWESRRPLETDSEMSIRHIKAKLECYRCPLLEDCEEMVCFFEERNQPVDGIVAGRYSTVIRRRAGERHIAACKACGQLLAPQYDIGTSRHAELKRHQGEQLCFDCYPKFSRKARKAQR